MQLHCSTQNAAKRKVTAKQKLRAGNWSGKLWTLLQPEMVHSVILRSYGGWKTHKDRSTYLRASNLKSQKHAGSNLLLFLEKSSMTLTQERRVTHLLLKKDQLRSSEGTMPWSPIKNYSSLYQARIWAALLIRMARQSFGSEDALNGNSSFKHHHLWSFWTLPNLSPQSQLFTRTPMS